MEGGAERAVCWCFSYFSWLQPEAGAALELRGDGHIPEGSKDQRSSWGKVQ